MIADSLPNRLIQRVRRIDRKPESLQVEEPLRAAFTLASAIVVVGFFLFAGTMQEPGESEARLGLASGEGLAPFGQVMGGWDPSLAPGRVLVSQIWRTIEGGPASVSAIRGPETLAALALGLTVAARLAGVMGARAGLFGLLAILGSFVMIDRSSATEVELVLGLSVFAAIDRLVECGSGWVAGLWTAAAFLLGGWPAVAVILLPTLILGRSGTSLCPGLLLPPAVAMAGWSAWALSVAKPEVWASAMTLPLTQPSAWTLAADVVVLALPFTPLAAVTLWPSARAGWNGPTRSLLVGWIQVATIALFAGTLIPGLAVAAKIPVLVALAMVSAVILEQAWEGFADSGPRRSVLGGGLVFGALGGLALVGLGGFLTVAQPYYRGVGFVLIGLGCATGLLAVDAIWIRSSRQAIRAMIFLAVGLKVAHGGLYAPEMNYRMGQGPWGRAIGQHIPPNWPIYVFHRWSPALALATEHPVRQLPAEVFLKDQPGGVKFVLLQDGEFTHWPEVAPPLTKVREFQDERGRVRVLARTEGKLNRRRDSDRSSPP